MYKHCAFKQTISASNIMLNTSVHCCGCPLLAIMHFQWLEAVSGIVRRQTSPHLQHLTVFWNPSKLISFPDHFLHNCFQLSSVHRV